MSSLIYKNPDGTYSYSGSTEPYASYGAAQYYGSRDAYYNSYEYTHGGASDYVKAESSSGKPLEFYGVSSVTGTISQEKLEKLKTGYLPEQLINLGEQRVHKIRTHEITDEEARERGISKVFGGKDYTKERRAERKAANRKARLEAGPAKPYAVLGFSQYFNPYGYANPNFPVLQFEASGRGTAQKDIRQARLTIMEIGEGGQFNYVPKSVELQQAAGQRKNVTAQLKAYTLLHGNQGQVSLLAVQAQAENERIRNEKLNQPTQISNGPQVTGKDIAQQIIREAQQKGATKITLYEGKEIVGSIPVNKSTQTTIELFLKNQNEISYSFSNPTKYKAEHKNIKSENQVFKNYVIELQRQGAEIEIRDKSGNLISTVKKNGPVLYEINKASKKYGEVSVTPKYSLETVVQSSSKIPEKPGFEQGINYVRGLLASAESTAISFGSGLYSLPSQLKENIEDVVKDPTILFKPFGKTYERPKEAQSFEQQYSPETYVGSLTSLQPSKEPASYQVGTLTFDIGFAIWGLKGVPGAIKGLRGSSTLKASPPTSGRIYKPIRTPSTIKIIKGFREGKIQHEIIPTDKNAVLYQGTEFEITPGSISEVLEPIEPYLVKEGGIFRKVREVSYLRGGKEVRIPEYERTGVRTVIPDVSRNIAESKYVTGIGSKGEKVGKIVSPKAEIPSAETSGQAQLPYVKVVKGGRTTIVRSEPQNVLPVNAVYAEGITPGQAVSLGLEEVKGLEGVYYAKATPHVTAHIGLAVKTEELTTGTDIFGFGKEITTKNVNVYAGISKNPELIKGNKFPEIVRPFVVRTFIGKALVKNPVKYNKLHDIIGVKKTIVAKGTRSNRKMREFKLSDFTNIGIGKVSAGAVGRAVALLESPTQTTKLTKTLPTKVTKPQKQIPRDYLGLSSQDSELGKYLVGKSNYEFTIETLAYPGNTELPTRSETTIASIRHSANKELNRIKNLTRRSSKVKIKQLPETVQSRRTQLEQVQAGITTERTDLLTKLITGTKQKNPFRQREPTKSKEKPIVIVSPIEIVGQKGKSTQIIKQIQKQIQTQKLKTVEQPKPVIPKEVFENPKPPKLPNLELKVSKEARKRVAKQGNRADFIGNASEFSFAGLYNRAEITYGTKKIRKITAKDFQLNTKGMRKFIQTPKHGKLSYPVKGKRQKKKQTKSSYRKLFR